MSVTIVNSQEYLFSLDQLEYSMPAVWPRAVVYFVVMTRCCFISVLGPAWHLCCPVVELVFFKTCFFGSIFSLEALRQRQKWLWMLGEGDGMDSFWGS